MSFSLEDAINLQTRKKKRHAQVMNKLITNVKERIKYHAGEVGNNYCEYKIPPFISGMCLYDLNDAIKHIVDTLSFEGFTIKIIDTNVLYIDWDIDNLSRASNASDANNAHDTRDARDATDFNYLKNFINSEKII